MVTFYTPPKKQVTKQVITLTVERLDAFGQGIANYNGKKVFIKNALPSEVVNVKLLEDKKQYAKAHVVKYLSTSAVRLKPACPHYGVCGGCEMQHIPLETQHAIKSQALVDLIAKETEQNIPAQQAQVIDSKPYHYRRRARLAILFENNKLVIGFRKAESNQIIDIKQCPVLVPQLQELLNPLKICLKKIKNPRALGHAELLQVDSGTILVIRYIKPLTEADKNLLTDFAKQYNISLYLHGDHLIPLSGETEHYYSVGTLKLQFSPLDFIQVNGEINLKMIKQALDWLNLKAEDVVLDLYCGMGNFSLPIAKLCQHVIGIEGVTALVEKAKKNAISNQKQLLGKADFYVANLDKVDNNPTWFNDKITKVVLDPARSGANQVMDTIIHHAPQRIVYISCNPATLARDNKKLISAGYKIAQATILDMFPQTKHIESMLLFTKLGTP
ncbi:23S rRNA (uracil(1939)-C(5))-methyltransferase RlmD [Orbaceae bacterium ac157xtp]